MKSSSFPGITSFCLVMFLTTAAFSQNLPVNSKEFLGTTDTLPLRFRVNNNWAGEIHPFTGNIFLGLGSGKANTTAGKNTAIGAGALQTQTFINSGIAWESTNVAVGFEALTLNNPTSTKNGISNTAIGASALRNNTIGFDNTALGAAALYSNNTGKENTALGRQSLFYNTTGNGNTGTGYKSLRANSEGYDNTAIGNYALTANTIGFDNTALGNAALFSNSIGKQNTALGRQALFYNTTGNGNTATGYKALRNNSTGHFNTANGEIALNSNTEGHFNTADGDASLTSNTTGSNNTATGAGALSRNTTGSKNTASGYDALSMNISGDLNTALGWGAGPKTASLSNTICVGNSAIATASNQVVLGNLFTAELICRGAYASTTSAAPNLYVSDQGQIGRTTSSRRYKKDIVPMEINTANIYKLKPVSYNAYTDTNRHFGLIAEDVAEVIPALATYAKEKDVVKGSTSEKMIPDAVQYSLLSVLILKEVQKHEQIILGQQQQITKQQQIIEMMQQQSEAVKAESTFQTARYQAIIEDQNNKIEMLSKKMEGVKEQLNKSK